MARRRRPGLAGAPAVVVAVAVVFAGCGEDGRGAASVASLPETTPADTSLIDVQGHRGARGLAPENTLPSFETALDIGVTTLELDLHLTADDQVVVWHDPVIEPEKCSGEGTGDPVRSLTAAEVRALRCDGTPDPERFPDQEATATPLAGNDFGIVTLGELFDFVAGYADAADKTPEQRANAAVVGFNVETKRRPDRPDTIGDGFDGTAAGPFELAVLAQIRARGLTDRVIVQSFDHRSLWAIGAEEPSIRLAALTRPGDAPDLADLAALGASIWSPDHRAVDEAAIIAAAQAGLAVIPWTVNEVEDMAALLDLGVAGLITDRPDWAVDLLAGEEPSASGGAAPTTQPEPVG